MSNSKGGPSGYGRTQRTANNTTNSTKRSYEYPRRLINEELLILCQEKSNAIEQVREELALQQQDHLAKATEEHPKSSSDLKPGAERKSGSDVQTGDGAATSATHRARVVVTAPEASEFGFVSEFFGAQPEEAGYLDVQLSETPTTILFTNKAFHLQTEKAEILDAAAKSLKQYKQLIATKVGNDNFIDHGVKTYMVTQRNCECQTEGKNLKESGAQADSFQIDAEISSESKTQAEVEMEQLMGHIHKEFSTNIANPFCLVQTDLESILIAASSAQAEINEERKKAAAASAANVRATQKINTSKVHNFERAGNATTSGNLQTASSGPTNENRTTNDKRVPTVSMATRQTPQISRGNTNNLSSGQGTGQGTIVDETLAEFGISLKNYNRQPILEREIKRFKEDLRGPLSHLVMSESEVKVFKNDGFRDSLALVEKVVLQSGNKVNFLSYNNQVSAVEDNKGKNNALKSTFMKRAKADESEKEAPGSLKHLFGFSSPRFEGKAVNVLNYNHQNLDLIAAGYGNARIVDGRSSAGCLAVWSVKNSGIPLRTYDTDSPVLSLKFSKVSPNLLAAGTAKGSLRIFDIRRKSNQPIMTSDDLEELKHLESIMEVDWICKGQGRDDYSESLVSISTDGKLLEWSMRKTLDVSELKQIVHTTNPQLKDPNELHSQNFRYSGGFSFDFHRKDPNIYLVSTEDGVIHKCSKSYKEQYLESYYGHSGPVYRVRNNPFHPDLFLSCSADWSIRVWNAKAENPLFVLKSLDLFDEVLDCRWNPYCSTSFASACRDGRVEVWDLALKSLDPIFTLKTDEKAKTCLEFSEKSPVVLIGNEAGEFQCARMFGYENQAVDEARQREAFDKIIAINLKNNEEANGPRGGNGVQ